MQLFGLDDVEGYGGNQKKLQLVVISYLINV